MENNTLPMLLTNLKLRSHTTDIPLDNQAAVSSFLETEKQLQDTYRLQRLLATSGMNKHQIRTFEQLNWDFNTKLPRPQINEFRSSSWIESASNLVLIGDVGIGKSHIAKALCYEAIQNGNRVFFSTAFDLISRVRKSSSYASKVEYFSKVVKVLCIDELGYTVYQKEDTDLLYQIIAKRSELMPTIITTNLVPKDWGTIFSGLAASAILDRLSSNGTFLTWEGRSYRKHGKKI